LGCGGFVGGAFVFGLRFGLCDGLGLIAFLTQPIFIATNILMNLALTFKGDGAGNDVV